MKTYRPLPELKISEDIYRTEINGLFYVPHHFFPDERGFYAEVARTPELEDELGIKFEIKQINHSRSHKNVIRGFHAEGWNKLVTIASGQVLSVLVDIRPNSPTFGKSVKFLLGNGEFEGQEALRGAIFVSNGIANGFAVLEGPADYIYVVDALYSDRDKSGDKAISLFDPDIGVEWPIPEEKRIFSHRDQDAITLRELFPDKF